MRYRTISKYSTVKKLVATTQAVMPLVLLYCYRYNWLTPLALLLISIMIILYSRSKKGARTIAHTLDCATKGPFVIYCSDDIRAVTLATKLANENVIVINDLLKWAGMLCLAGFLAWALFNDSAIISSTELATVQFGIAIYYLGAGLNFAWLALDAYKA